MRAFGAAFAKLSFHSRYVEAQIDRRDPVGQGSRLQTIRLLLGSQRFRAGERRIHRWTQCQVVERRRRLQVVIVWRGNLVSQAFSTANYSRWVVSVLPTWPKMEPSIKKQESNRIVLVFTACLEI